MKNPDAAPTLPLLSLRKSRQILKSAFSSYKKQGHRLTSKEYNFFETLLRQLDGAVLEKNREEASDLAWQVEGFCKKHFPKSLLTSARELIGAIAVAFLIAVFIRQVWFEPYQIPSGSMRPTFEEKDRLTVSKTTFGINYPVGTGHFYFDPNLVQRGSVLIFSSQGIDFLDETTRYFWVIPYKKRVIKRLIGKPGDTLYFYGGRIYGIDEKGNDLKELRDPSWMQDLEFLPYISFEGRKEAEATRNPSQANVVFYQMNEPLGRVVFTQPGTTQGQIYTGKKWKPDRPELALAPHQTPVTYGDFWGIGNFAMTRLLTKEQVLRFTDQPVEETDAADLYLEIRHNANMTYPKARLVLRSFQQYEPVLQPYTSIIPLQKTHLDAILGAMYTSRFVIKDGRASRYSMLGEKQPLATQPLFPDVPDGTYEFYYGQAVQIDWAGIATLLPKDHPLYRRDKENIQRLYNLGIEFGTDFGPHSRFQTTFPNRYTYFRDGDLHLMGKPILFKNDPTLVTFHTQETAKLAKATAEAPYIPFQDRGAPFTNGQIDGEFIRAFGVRIPEGHYLVLGDNHAMSGDSRLFGFLPEANIQGAPSLIFWPPSQRIGTPNMKPYPWTNLPRAAVWTFFSIAGIAFLFWDRRQKSRPLFPNPSTS